MKKIAILGIASLLIGLPLAACNGGENASEEPALTAPLPAPPEEGETLPAQAEYIMTRTDGLNVRSGAGTSFAALGQVEKNILLHYDGTENGWYKTYYRGKTAYVSAGAQYTSLAALEEGDARTERVIREGLKLLGTPYVYGAARYHDGKGNLNKNFTTEKFDCSSLMQYIFSRGAGIMLDVTTRTQILQGKKVANGDLQRGDLMFFTNASRKNNKGLERVGHVALYLGDNYILHTASDYAKIEQISSTRWSYFIEARRVL